MIKKIENKNKKKLVEMSQEEKKEIRGGSEPDCGTCRTHQNTDTAWHLKFMAW